VNDSRQAFRRRAWRQTDASVDRHQTVLKPGADQRDARRGAAPPVDWRNPMFNEHLKRQEGFCRGMAFVGALMITRTNDYAVDGLDERRLF